MEELRRKLKETIVKKGDFQLASGKHSNYYLDIKSALQYPEIIKELADRIWQEMRNDITCVVGSGIGGITLATAIASRHHIKLTLIRDKPKTYGTKSQIEGYIPKERDKVSIVDDVFTTGESLIRASEVIKLTNAEIKDYHVIIKRGENKLGIPLSYLFTEEDFINSSSL